MAVFAIRQPEFQTWDEFSHWGIYFKSVFYQHRFAVWDTTRSLARQAYPQGLPGLYALFALPAAQYREADVLFVTALPLAAAASALFALPQVTARRPRIAYTVCACLAAPALFWLFAPDTPYTTAYMDAPVGALFAAALCVILLPCAANSRVQRGLALALLCGALTTVKEIGTVFALCVVGIWFLQCLLDALRDKGGILRGFLLPFTAALPCFAIPLAWKLLLKALHRADDQFSSMGPGYFLQCWQEARTGFDRYFYDVWDRYYARLRSYPLLFGASTFKVGCLCAAAAVLLLIVLIWAMGRWQFYQMPDAPAYQIAVALKVAVLTSGGTEDFGIGHGDGRFLRHDQFCDKNPSNLFRIAICKAANAANRIILLRYPPRRSPPAHPPQGFQSRPCPQCSLHRGQGLLFLPAFSASAS